MGSEHGRHDPGPVAAQGSAVRIYELLVSESKLIATQLRWGGFRRLDLRTRTILGNSADKAIEALNAPTDVVVLESNANAGDVFELCAELKKACPSLPVVVINEGALSQSVLPRVAASGCDEVLSTPLSRGQLYHVLAKLLDLPRRRNYRVKIKARVSARGTIREIGGEVHDLSVSGARIQLEDPFVGETQLSVVIETPDGELELPGSVIWHRPSVRGGELAVQFKPVSEQVAERLETLSTWRVDRQGEQQVVELQRSLNERANFTGLPEQLSGHVVFDMRHLSLIASAGVGVWVAFLHKLSSDVTFELVNCPVNFCVQASYIPGMMGQGRVSSFYAPYYCAGCNSEVERELDTSSVVISEPMGAPEQNCSVCGGKLEFEDLPERFFKFIKR
jgi:CheY-like chemotaxis protein